MDRLILHNDRISPLEEARLSPGQVGLLMGWGVFTTLRIYRGIPFAFERHWARLERDAHRLEVALPFDQEAVRRAIMDLARANQRPEGMARVSFVKNAGGLWAEARDLPATDLLVFTRELVAWPAGHRLRLKPMGIFSAGQYAGAKMLSWVPHTAVLDKAHAEGFDDALLLNEKKQIAECTSANIFLAGAGKVFTPPLSSGCLPGITREILLEIGPVAGVPIQEKDLSLLDLESADEVFITSTTREVAGVQSISPGPSLKTPGRTTLELQRLFHNYVQTYLDRA